MNNDYLVVSCGNSKKNNEPFSVIKPILMSQKTGSQWLGDRFEIIEGLRDVGTIVKIEKNINVL